MAEQKQQPKKITTEPETFEESKAATEGGNWPLFSKLIGDGVASIIESRANASTVTKMLDSWKLCASPEEITAAKAQMETAKLAMEGLYIHFKQITA